MSTECMLRGVKNTIKFYNITNLACTEYFLAVVLLVFKNPNDSEHVFISHHCRQICFYMKCDFLTGLLKCYWECLFHELNSVVVITADTPVTGTTVNTENTWPSPVFSCALYLCDPILQQQPDFYSCEFYLFDNFNWNCLVLFGFVVWFFVLKQSVTL